MDFSVIIPVYNKAPFVARAIESVLSQTYPPSEIIVVNDGSTDNSLEIVSQFAERNDIVRVVNQRNAGVSAARNNGVRCAKGDWVAFLDADDQWLSGFLSELCKIIQSFPAVGMVGTNYYRHSGGCYSWKKRPLEVKSIDFFRSFVPSQIPFNSSSFAVRRDLFLTIGGYDTSLSYFEDAEMMFRLAHICSVAISGRPLSVYEDVDPKSASKILRPKAGLRWPHITYLEKLQGEGMLEDSEFYCAGKWLIEGLSKKVSWTQVRDRYPELCRRMWYTTLPWWALAMYCFGRRVWRYLIRVLVTERTDKILREYE